MFYDDLQCLNYPLPEDILKLKGFGDYARLGRVIDLRLADENLPEALKVRLRLEKEMASRIPGDYPYGFDEALSILQDSIEGFTAAELEEARDLNAVDWIYVNGEVRFFDAFARNLIRTRPALWPRVKHRELLDEMQRDIALREDAIREMRQNGGAARRWHMKHTLSVDGPFVRPGQEILVHLPVPLEYDYVRNFRLIAASPEGWSVSGPLSAQRTIAFRKPLEEGDVFSVEYSFETHMPYHDLDAGRALGGLPQDGMDDALAEQPPHIAFTPMIRRVAREIAGDETTRIRLARRIYDFLTKQPIYSLMRNYFTYPNLPEYMLTSMKGDCGVFAQTFITLCRALGIPARWQSGRYCAPGDTGSHDWAQFYCEPWGWLPVDVSFGNAAWHQGSALRHDFYFGNLDPFRLPACRAYQQPFDPPKRFIRWDPYDNQLGEADYADAGLTGEQRTSRLVMLDWEVLPWNQAPEK